MYPFEKVTLNVAGDKYSDGIEFRFRSDDESIVKVDSKGQITAGGKPLKTARPDGIDFSVFQLRTLISF